MNEKHCTAVLCVWMGVRLHTRHLLHASRDTHNVKSNIAGTNSTQYSDVYCTLSSLCVANAKRRFYSFGLVLFGVFIAVVVLSEVVLVHFEEHFEPISVCLFCHHLPFCLFFRFPFVPSSFSHQCCHSFIPPLYFLNRHIP